MALTLRALLTLGPVRRAEPIVLAAEEQLDRLVRWVHIAEPADIADLLRGGELILTTGMGIAANASVQKRYLAELSAAGASGLMIELGRTFQRIPDSMIATAVKLMFPLIALQRETPFVDITEAVHREIINRQYEQLRQAETVSRELAELILNGTDIRAITNRLADIFGNPVVLEDEAHQVVEIAGARSWLELIPSSWEQHSRVHHHGKTRGAVNRSIGDPQCLWMDIWIGHQPWGRLHVLEDERRLDDITELLVDRAGAALALAVLAEKSKAQMVDRAGSALIGELATGRHGSTESFLRRARTLGADFRNGRLAVVAMSASEAAEESQNRVSEDDRLEWRLSVVSDLRNAAQTHGCVALAGLHSDRIIAVLAVPGTRTQATVVEQIVQESMRPHFAELVTAGTSYAASADELYKALGEAVTAMSFARISSPSHRIRHYSDLGTLQLLMQLAQGPELARFVEFELSPLLDYDVHTRSKLFPTLRAYLANAGRKADTLRALSIQRRTLYARIKRIEALLHRDLEDQITRTRLTLAIQGFDLLQSRGSLVGLRARRN